ncbi:MAG TPA: LysM peptidoglycan-binding domain-containing protein [Clostridia bacterium]|nr:LysM peptidoglycan-binding domain-containing protein [Clostridia bacterium]
MNHYGFGPYRHCRGRLYYRQPPQAPLGTITYRVRPGDTLYSIARNFNTTVHNILVFNDIPNPDLIFVGQVLIIPLSPPESIIYTVRPGDTLYLIAIRFGTSIAVLTTFNYLDNPNLIFPGQQLVVPASLR